jgi:DNA-directed RNA polymerase specialized sigma24 family protein
MTTMRTHESGFSKKLLPLLAVVALVMSLDAILPSAIKAEIRVRAQIVTPALDVSVRTGRVRVPVAPVQVRPIRSRPVPPPPTHVLPSKADRRIAARLARLTSYRASKLLDLRLSGMSWTQIGGVLEIPPHLMQVAMHPGRNRHGARWQGHRRGEHCGR